MSDGGEPRLVVWSASEAATARRARHELADRLADLDGGRFAAVTFPDGRTGRPGPIRGAVVAASGDEAARLLRAAPGDGDAHPARGRPVALLFPGQGAQHPRMAVGLYRHYPAFTDSMDAVFELMGAEGSRVRADWLASEPAVPLDHVTRSQPMLFAVDVALGRLLMGWGVRPAAMLGHSVGEVAAATLAGVFDLADAVALMADRVERLAATPPGGMLAVAASVEQVRPFLRGEVVVGVVNGPRQVLLAGPTPQLSDVEEEVRRAGLVCRRVRATSAYHSPAVTDAVAGSESVLAAVAPREPELPLYSGYTGRLLGAEVTDPRFWARQPAAPVLFGPALDAVLADLPLLLVEAGPAQGLTSLARRHPAVASARSEAVALLPTRPGRPVDDRRAVLAAMARIWTEGHDLAPGVPAATEVTAASARGDRRSG